MTTKSSSRQAERRDQRRQDILAAASRLFSVLGYENVTLRAIAEELGYAHATLYRYFPDKSHLLAEICKETFALLLQEFDALAAALPHGKARLVETSRGFIRFGLAHPQHFRIVFFGPEDRNGVRAGDYINEIGRPMFERLVATFLACIEGDEVRLADPLLDAHCWWSSVIGLTWVLLVRGELPGQPSSEQMIERTIQVLWNGMGVLPTE
jgi:AcrR family transcriptional regulator